MKYYLLVAINAIALFAYYPREVQSLFNIKPEKKIFANSLRNSEDVGILVVRSDSEIANLDELVKGIKRKNDPIVVSFSTPKNHFGYQKADLLLKAFQLEKSSTLRFVTYGSGTSAIYSVKAGHTEVCFCSLSDFKLASTGEFRILAVLSKKRLRDNKYKEYPTAIELGYDLTWVSLR